MSRNKFQLRETLELTASGANGSAPFLEEVFERLTEYIIPALVSSVAERESRLSSSNWIRVSKELVRLWLLESQSSVSKDSIVAQNLLSILGRDWRENSYLVEYLRTLGTSLPDEILSFL